MAKTNQDVAKPQDTAAAPSETPEQDASKPQDSSLSPSDGAPSHDAGQDDQGANNQTGSAAASAKPQDQSAAPKQKRVRIVLRRSERDKGKKHQEVGLNGVVHMVPYDMEVEVLPGVVEILKNSVIHELVEQGDDAPVMQTVSRFALHIKE